MHPAEVESCLETMVLLSDTREKPTDRYRARIRQIGLPVERVALNVGDYSAKMQLPDGSWFQLPISLERKMDATELAMCYCQERDRFEREFQRAIEAGTSLYLIVEDTTWQSIYAGEYRSRMRPKSLVASILTWLARYHCQLILCAPSVTGWLIRDILYYEARELLLQMEEGDKNEH